MIILKRYIALVLTLFLAFAVAGPATQTDLGQAAISVSIEIETPMEEIRYGSSIRLRCIIEGLEKPYHIQWQSSENVEEWVDLPCEEEVFEFILDEQNADLYYRVVVSKSDE